MIGNVEELRIYLVCGAGGLVSLKTGIRGTLCEDGEGSACNPLYFEKLLLRLEQL